MLVAQNAQRRRRFIMLQTLVVLTRAARCQDLWNSPPSLRTILKRCPLKIIAQDYLRGCYHRSVKIGLCRS